MQVSLLEIICWRIDASNSNSVKMDGFVGARNKVKL
jgi:hypothetical protein